MAYSRLVEDAKAACDKIHQSTAPPPKQVLEQLKDVKDHIELLIDAMECSLHGLEDQE